jgi:hypothetical protein
MRKLAVALLVVTGCAAAPTGEQDDAPAALPAQESASGEIVLGSDEVGGGRGTSVAEPGGTSTTDAPTSGGGGVDAWGDADVASWMPTALGAACFDACVVLTGGGCMNTIWTCTSAEVMSAGSSTVPCVVAVAVACGALVSSRWSCPAICPG